MNYTIIKDTQTLAQVCEKARLADVIMLDTEFVRTRTYHPQLGLIQLFDGEQLVLIDPLEIDDMDAFSELLKDQSVMKILHACGEDLEVFQHSFGCIPNPMIDTQLMAAFLGHGLSTGFASLVNEYLSVELDKSESRADWLARPLTDKQLDYAAADVYYLLPLYQQLLAKVEDKGWLTAVQQESNLLISKRLKTSDPELAYLDIKGAWTLDPEQLAILKVIAKWRLLEAQKRDLALNFVVKEANVLEICRLKMASLKQMNEAGFDHREIRRHGNTLIEMVKQGLDTPQSEWPDKITRLMDNPAYKQLFKRLKDEVKTVSETTGLATEFLASKKQLNQFITWVWMRNRSEEKLPDVMRDWRKNILGDVLNGKMD
ncbi:ribonuclease D [Vibrio rumoiensis]|uniref:Ribonuclease D n=1 Tax=Vibrio rumoiensis 1S-45 TaxID=1188252 RepID=A0A1E5E0N4_9VIBR|nr:ribonuclease D [Vibrio rumoiensis]OEF24051.1 ribonuclease D [Vibrio rumoiensis 1S-45]